MAYLLAFLSTVVAIAMYRRYADASGFIAEPRGHREHTHATPVVGGIGMYFGVCASWWLLDGPASFVLACLIVVVCGVWDDRHELPSSVRFFFQVVACGVMVYFGDVVLMDLGYLFDDENLVLLGRWGVALTMFGAVGVINSINMSDGMDGLAGSLVLVSLLIVLAFALVAGMRVEAAEIGVVVSAICAFLLFNLRWQGKPAGVFMGDAGSMLLGLALAWYLIKHTQAPYKVFPPVVALWIVALPLFDTVGVLVRRTLKGRSPFLADRMHYHHYLLEMGLSVNQALILILFTALLLAVAGIAANHLGLPEHISFYVFLGLFVCYGVLMEAIERRISQSRPSS